ncbi:hypothetical protein ACWEUT_43510, partial [Actinomadura geliboluensis]
MDYTVVVPTVGRESLRGTLRALLAALDGGPERGPHEIIVAVVSRTLVPRYPIFIALAADHPLAGRDEIDLV